MYITGFDSTSMGRIYSLMLNCASEGDIKALRYFVELGRSYAGEEYEEDEQEEGKIRRATLTRKRKRKIKKKIQFDLNARDYEGRSALHYACFYGNLKCVEYLVENGADVNGRDSIGQTPLFYASHGCDCFIFTFLIKHNADINAKNDVGNTCLHNVVMWGDINVVFFMIECGADSQIRNADGKKPSQLIEHKAFEHNRTYVEIIELLEDYPVYPWSVQNHISNATKRLLRKLKENDLANAEDDYEVKLTKYQQYMEEVMRKSDESFMAEEEVDDMEICDMEEAIDQKENEALVKAKLRNLLLEKWKEKAKTRRLEAKKLQEAIFNVSRQLKKSIEEDKKCFENYQTEIAQQ
eukprot:Nk52_evm22s356 gene=Nk52_evmTU22s356